MAAKVSFFMVFALVILVVTSEVALAEEEKGCVPECKRRCVEVKAKRMRPCMKLCTKCCDQCGDTTPPVCKELELCLHGRPNLPMPLSSRQIMK